MDIKRYLVYSLIIVLISINSFLIVTTVYVNDQITQKFNFENFDEYIGVIADENRVIFDYNINQEFMQTGLSFNEELSDKDKVKLEIEFNIDEVIKESKLEFIMGFSDIDEMINQKGYFTINLEDNQLVFENYGKEFQTSKKVKLVEENNEIKITYLLDNENNKIHMIIKINEEIIELTANLNNEFEKGFKVNDFMFSVNKLENTKFMISNLKLTY